MTFPQQPSFQKIAQRNEAIYLEPSFYVLGKVEAGFHLALAFARLDGMTGFVS